MKRRHLVQSTLTLLLSVLAGQAALYAQVPLGSAFTYQGQLKQSGAVVTGQANMLLRLYDAESAGTELAAVGPESVDVVDGLFTVEVDFGVEVFDGQARWLEIEVEFPAGAGNWTTLSPRQPLNATPYALHALSGPGSGGFWAASGDDIHNTNSGNVGIGTPSPTRRLHVEGNSSPVAYVRNNGAGGRALHASSDGTAVYAMGGACGLDAYSDSPTGNAISAFNEAESGNAYAVYAENISPDGIAIYGRAGNSDSGSTGIGVYGHSDSDGGAGVYGEAPYLTGSAYGVRGVSAYGTGVQGERQDTGNFGALGRRFEGVYGESAYGVSGIGVHGKWTGSFPGFGYGGVFATTSYLAAGVLGRNEATQPGGIGVLGLHEHTSGAGYGVRGETASPDGYAGYFENTASGSYGALAGNAFGVQGRGNTAGGHFENIGASGYAYAGYGDLGIEARGECAGGYFVDEDNFAYAYVGYGNRGIEAKGSEAGGYFEDTDGSGQAYLGYGNSGIEAQGSGVGGQFENTGNGAISYLADSIDGTGISAYGPTAGGYFADQDGTGFAYVAHGDRGLDAYGDEYGGYFADTSSSSHAYAASGINGIEAYGSQRGGYFENTDGTCYAYVAGSDPYGVEYGIKASGSVGGRFVAESGGGYASIGTGSFGIDAMGSLAGGHFLEPSSWTWSYVANNDGDKISSNGSCNFVQNHPEDTGLVISYACPEGDEVATYTRGTARLLNGVARVPLGETFKWVTNPDIGLTAHLTLRGDSPGLYVDSLSTEELVVREVGGGTSDVGFDYLVYGLRIGFEEVAVVREKEIEAYIPSMASHRERYERSPELRDYNALQRFRRMRAAAGQTEPLDLSASQALHDTIVEFDPALHLLDERRERQAPESIEMSEDWPTEQHPDRAEPVDPKDAELAALRARLDELEALVAELAARE